MRIHKQKLDTIADWSPLTNLYPIHLSKPQPAHREFTNTKSETNMARPAERNVKSLEVRRRGFRSPGN
ncbi:hypothetical protein TNCV_4666881 [Trichonephila clavipes]|nr:hypothetical protein TNCV_4666881 [Trichonephila clavipes]